MTLNQLPLNSSSSSLSLESTQHCSGTNCCVAKRQSSLALFGITRVSGMLIMAAIAILNWPVDTVQVKDDTTTYASYTMPLGRTFTTSIIHSLEQTPVKDTYHVLNQFIWTWQERTKSHNAGLPYMAPSPGQFYIDPPWMVIQGGRQAMEAIAYRVGTPLLGKNELTIEPKQWIPLYLVFPQKRLMLVAEKKIFRMTGDFFKE